MPFQLYPNENRGLLKKVIDYTSSTSDTLPPNIDLSDAECRFLMHTIDRRRHPWPPWYLSTSVPLSHWCRYLVPTFNLLCCCSLGPLSLCRVMWCCITCDCECVVGRSAERMYVLGCLRKVQWTMSHLGLHSTSRDFHEQFLRTIDREVLGGFFCRSRCFRLRWTCRAFQKLRLFLPRDVCRTIGEFVGDIFLPLIMDPLS